MRRPTIPRPSTVVVKHAFFALQLWKEKKANFTGGVKTSRHKKRILKEIHKHAVGKSSLLALTAKEVAE